MWAALALTAAELQREVWTSTAVAGTERGLLAALGVVMTAAVAASRRAPLASAITGFAALLCVDVVASPWEIAPLLGFATVPLGYMLGRWTEGRPRLIGTAVAFVALVIVAVRYATDPDVVGYPIGSAITQVALSLAPIWLGATNRDRAALHAGLAAAAERATTDRERALQRTVLDERARIATELHDLIAHALSAVIVQASAARVHAPHGGDAAAGAFAAVEETGREALTEIRSMLDVLRGPGDASIGSLEPQPSVAALPRLLDRAPLETTLAISGEPLELPASVDLTAYRMVQEAIATAVAAGASTATVDVVREAGSLTLSVADDGSTVRPPLASRERVRLYGGEYFGQPGRGGGFVARVRLPIREAS